MDTSAAKAQEYQRRLLMARMVLMSRNGFFGLLMMHMKFALNESVQTAATDGERLYFAPSFLNEISDRELIFILQHEIMHVVLRHCMRTGERDNYLFNVACDIVVNSIIKEASGNDARSITLDKYGESMHLAPDGKEGCNYTAEEVYEMLVSSADKHGIGAGRLTDNHSRWGTSKTEGLSEEWMQRIREALEAGGNGRGNLPLCLRREIDKYLKPRVDWRVILNDFVQEEITDYSFTPPDRRFSDSPFFLPDFNERDETVRNILFMIDTSGSMSREEVTQAYSEIKGAIDQYAGKLAGWLGFFDHEVVPPKPFTDESEFELIQPYGGGGTSFEVIFEYVRKEMSALDVTSIIILTDGYADFPDRSEAMGIPVLWMINNEDVDPPWGRIVRI